LQHFGKIGTGDIVLLAEEIEKENKERERMLRGEDTSTTGTNVLMGSTGSGEDVGETGVKMGVSEDVKAEGVSASNTLDNEDVKMEDR
jgi:THO complex subunit 1